jgi:hypothetical protein
MEIEEIVNALRPEDLLETQGDFDDDEDHLVNSSLNSLNASTIIRDRKIKMVNKLLKNDNLR